MIKIFTLAFFFAVSNNSMAQNTYILTASDRKIVDFYINRKDSVGDTSNLETAFYLYEDVEKIFIKLDFHPGNYYIYSGDFFNYSAVSIAFAIDINRKTKILFTNANDFTKYPDYLRIYFKNDIK